MSTLTLFCKPPQGSHVSFTNLSTMYDEQNPLNVYGWNQLFSFDRLAFLKVLREPSNYRTLLVNSTDILTEVQKEVLEIKTPLVVIDPHTTPILASRYFVNEVDEKGNMLISVFQLDKTRVKIVLDERLFTDVIMFELL